MCIRGKMGAYGAGQRLGTFEFSARFCRAVKISIAKCAFRKLTVFFAPRPQVATRKTAKDSGAACVEAFSLQRIKYFFDCKAHCVTPFCQTFAAVEFSVFMRAGPAVPFGVNTGIPPQSKRGKIRIFKIISDKCLCCLCCLCWIFYGEQKRRNFERAYSGTWAAKFRRRIIGR